MTFVEFVLLILTMVILYLILRPLQRKLEHQLMHFFKSRNIKKGKTVIDITDYKKTTTTEPDKDKK